MRIQTSLFTVCLTALVVVRSVFAVPARHHGYNEKDGGTVNYQVGLGIADITGPSVEVNMMGYAAINQTDSGIHIRQRSRAFIVVDPSTNQRIVYVSADICMGGQAIRRGVLQELNNLYGNLYGEQNVAIAGTHTHAGPGGYLQYVLFQITSLGYIPQTAQAIIDGIVRSIQRAHDNLTPGNIFVSSGDVQDGNINRSPSGYDNNPEEEKARYQYNTDHTMTMLKFLDANGKALGQFNWYAVHCTSMHENNTLISGDNKGYASYIFEQNHNPQGTLPGQGSFVAAFAQANVGDTSPNTLGAFCEDTGLPCDYATSTCGNPPRTQECKGRGPGWPTEFFGFESTKIIGTRQAETAESLFESSGVPLAGSVGSIHQYVNMTQYTFTLNNVTVKPCKPALGYSFAGGTTDGPGQLDFKQGDNSTGNIFWNIVRGVIAEPNEQQIACHKPKPILLDTGDDTFPYAWSPTIVDTQILRIGQFVLLVFPGEATTMAGRRMRETIKQVLVDQGKISNDSVVILTGPANTYTHYVATFEEYQAQRYEGASTLYGPNTLAAYQQIYSDLALSLFNNATLALGPSPPDLTTHAIELITPPPMDAHPLLQDFGHVVTDVQSSYKIGDIVTAIFVAGNPRNNLTSESTFLSVEQQQSNGSWNVVRTDGDWSTKFNWAKDLLTPDESQATITWEIEQATPAGTYRIGYFGSHKLIDRSIQPHSGYSSNFTVSG